VIMKHSTKRIVIETDVDSDGVVHAEKFFRWLYAEVMKYSSNLLNKPCLIRHVYEVDIKSPVKAGSILEISLNPKGFGDTSVSIDARVTDRVSDKSYLTIKKLILVAVDENLKPAEHGVVSEDDCFLPYGWLDNTSGT